MSWAASNGLFGSAKDLSLFVALLANGGVQRGKRVLGAAAVREMASDLNDDGLECQGTNTRRWGVGGSR